MAAARAIPIILCGKTEAIGAGVIAGLRPQYEVIHFIMSPESGIAQLPLLLQGKEAPSDSSLGTKNYSRPPAAVVVGAAFNDDMLTRMRGACEGQKQLPWFRPDLTKPAPPVGPEYGKAMVSRVRARLAEAIEKGEMEGGEVLWF